MSMHTVKQLDAIATLLDDSDRGRIERLREHRQVLLYETHPDYRARYELLAPGLADYLPAACAGRFREHLAHQPRDERLTAPSLFRGPRHHAKCRWRNRHRVDTAGRSVDQAGIDRQLRDLQRRVGLEPQRAAHDVVDLVLVDRATRKSGARPARIQGHIFAAMGFARHSNQ